MLDGRCQVRYAIFSADLDNVERGYTSLDELRELRTLRLCGRWQATEARASPSGRIRAYDLRVMRA